MSTCTKHSQYAQGQDRPAPEGGNVWFAEPEPVELAGWDVVAIYVAVCLAALVSFATVIGLVGFAYGRWLA